LDLKHTVGVVCLTPAICFRSLNATQNADRNHAGHSNCFHILLLTSRNDAIQYSVNDVMYQERPIRTWARFKWGAM
jgi:hypothetical protein